MAVTKIHGGMDESITSQLQFTSQMSDYALTNHTHNFTVTGTVVATDHSHSQYLTTAALSSHTHLYAATNHTHTYAASNHTHSQYITTAALSNHTHNQYLNTSESGNVYFQNGNGVTFGSSASLMSTTITASVNAGVSPSGNIIFLNSNGHTFNSSISGQNTYYWISI